jgi:hypothetical protein
VAARRAFPASSIALAILSALFAEERAARAQEATGTAETPPPNPVSFSADDVRLDAHSQALDASGHVRVDEPPFHLTSDALTLRRVPIGAELDGDGKLAFCPCLGEPLAVRFTGATVAPPHDVILRNPVLEVFGVPLAWAPVFWLRSPGRFGLLPPDLAWRGADGFFAGGGVHVPWKQGDVVRGLDLRGGGYVDGGVAVETSLRTSATMTRVRWDRLHGHDGVAIGAQGTAGGAPTESLGTDPNESVAWGIEALRGARAVQATTDVEAAARPFDRGAAEVSWRPEQWVISSGVRTVALRGGDVLDLGAGGPVVAARRADALGHAGTYDATVEGGEVFGIETGATSFGRAEGGMLLATRVGAIGASLALRAMGDVADDGTRQGWDGTAQARAEVTLPLAREYPSAADVDASIDPWVHRTEPRLEAAVLALHSDGVLVAPAGRGLIVPIQSGGAWIAAAGWSNAVGRLGSRAGAEVDAVAGAVGDDIGVLPVLRGRASVGGPWLALRADVARVFGLSSATRAVQAGGAFIAAARVGPSSGLHLAVHAADRDGVDPILARAAIDPPFESASGFLSATGWTGGARVALPIGSRVTTLGGADVDLEARELVAAIGALELHDPCNCVVVRASAAHRIGRGGVDAWLSVDLPLER